MVLIFSKLVYRYNEFPIGTFLKSHTKSEYLKIILLETRTNQSRFLIHLSYQTYTVRDKMYSGMLHVKHA